MKKTFTYLERNEELREEFNSKISKISVKKLVFLDESGINTHLQREHGRALRGEKVHDVMRGRLFHRTNIIAALCNKKYIAIEVYDNPTNALFFESWFKNSLLKNISKGHTIVLDNARFHRKKVLQEIADKHKMNLLFLPPYSPDLNKIEKSWANMKKWLQSNACRYTKLQEAIYDYFYIANI